MSDLMIMYDYYMALAEESKEEHRKMYELVAGAISRKIESMI